MMEPAPDRHDVQASLHGDEQAFARLVKRYQGAVAARMWRFTRDRGVLEELTQEVFVEAYLSLRSYRAEAPFLHWLSRIATRVGYRHWKNQARARRLQDSVAEADEEGGGRAARDLTPSEAASVAHRLLERLPPADRLVLTLLYLDERTTGEIADLTGWSRTLVKVRAFRARKKLQRLMEEKP